MIEMQVLVDTLSAKGKLYKKMQEVAPKDLGIRKKIKIYSATDRNGKFSAMIAVSQKSRILMKDVENFEEILSKLMLFVGHSFSYKMIFIDAPLCSKAKSAFIEQGWKIH